LGDVPPTAASALLRNSGTLLGLKNRPELAQILHSKLGSSAEIEELAGWMNQSAGGGTFRTCVRRELYKDAASEPAQ